MSGDEQGLIAAIRDDPDDDAMRLVYADWLDDNGRADHAELIRLQIAIARGAKVKGQKLRAAKLERALMKELPAGLKHTGVTWRRGMLAATWYGCSPFADWLHRYGATGVVERLAEAELTFIGDDPQDRTFSALAESGAFAAVTRLIIHRGGSLTPAPLVAFLKSPHAAGLRALSIKSVDFGAAGAAALASSPHLANLRKLEIWSPLGATGAKRIVNSKTLAEVRELILLGNADDDAAQAALIGATGLPALRSLYLTSNKIGDARLRLLLTSPLLPRLTELVLAGNKIRDGGAKALAECEALRGLKSLNLNGNQIGDAGARALLESPHLDALEEIDLQWQPKIGEPTLKALHKRYKKREA